MTFAAGLGTAAAVTMTGLLVAITDNLSAHVVSGLNADLEQALQGVGTGLQTAAKASGGPAPGDGAAVPRFAGFLAAVIIVVAVAVGYVLVRDRDDLARRRGVPGRNAGITPTRPPS